MYEQATELVVMGVLTEAIGLAAFALKCLIATCCVWWVMNHKR